ncbi:MAG: TonB-dependent receptor, partial [Bacteroidetes bacterium]|nr:TonB-dependent receptor [Fibrella sp.]
MRLFFTCFLFLHFFAFAHGQPSAPKTVYAFTGYVRDAKTNQPIAGTNVFVQEIRQGVTTGKDGFFVLSLPTGRHSIRFSHVGWIPVTQTITLTNENLLLNLTLTEDTKYLEEVIVTSEAPDRNVRKVELGVSTLSIKSIKRIPAFMGEVDVVRSLLLLPGVTTVGEGATGINVRGGSIDQNLMLLDDAPIFNSGHLFGFFSVFNPDVVREATLYRGGIAAAYGGRASAILDVKVREPEAEKWAVTGGIGLISNRLSVEGPLISKKFFVLAATRVSFNDFLFPLGPASLRDTRANFYDVTTKLKYLFNEQHSLAFTGYAGKDLFKLPGDSLSTVEVNASSTQYDYRTLAGTLRWNYFINDRFNLATSAIWSDYQVVSSVPDPANAFRLTADVRHRQLKSDLSIRASDAHQVQTGLSVIDYAVQPNQLVPGLGSNVLPVTLTPERAYELSAYVQDEWTLSGRLSVQAGLRYSQFMNRGPATVRTYPDGTERTPSAVSSTQPYSGGQVYNQVGGLEPRFSLRYSLSETQSIKLGYNRMRQYIHLVTNTTAALPTSRWKLSDPYIKPQITDQVSVGYFRNTTGNAIELSGEVYYKTLQNAIDYKDGANLQLNDTPETDLLQGSGQAYGLETMLRKNKGAWTGWVSYTFSRTFLTITSPVAAERVNNGTRYPANYDKPHNLNAVAVYRPSLRFSLSLNFTYSTGRPVTQPYGRALINGVFVPIYVNRNQERIPDYHRLDFSMNFDPDPAKAKRFQSSWIFALYNVYGRR